MEVVAVQWACMTPVWMGLSRGEDGQFMGDDKRHVAFGELEDVAAGDEILVVDLGINNRSRPSSRKAGQTSQAQDGELPRSTIRTERWRGHSTTEHGETAA